MDIETLKVNIGSAIAHGTYLDEEAREAKFNEIVKQIEQLLVESRIEELKNLQESASVTEGAAINHHSKILNRIKELNSKVKK